MIDSHYHIIHVVTLPDDDCATDFFVQCTTVAKSIEDLWYILINKRKYIKHVADVYTTTCSLHTYTNPSKKIFPAWGNISLEHVQIAMERS